MWRLNNVLINNQRSKQKSKLPVTSENESTNLQNLWDAARRVIREKFIPIQNYLKEQEGAGRLPNKSLNLYQNKN